MTDDTAMRSANYAIDEAAKFLDRHPDANAHALGGMAALTFGLMRALYECPHCPGESMIPVSETLKAQQEPPLVGDWWVCARCLKAWRYKDVGEA